MSKYLFKISEFKESLVRVFKDQDIENCHIHMDGRQAQNKFLAQCWNYANDNDIIKVTTVENDQECFMKGYLTEKGKRLLKI